MTVKFFFFSFFEAQLYSSANQLKTLEPNLLFLKKKKTPKVLQN